MTKQIKFYQNNPCVIIRDIDDNLAEVVIGHQFAGDMELTGQCMGCNVGDSDNKLACTCDEHSWIIEEVQEEVNRIFVIVEKRLLTDKPIEHLTLIDLHKQVLVESESFAKTKLLHEEWRQVVKCYKDQSKALKTEIESLTVSTAAASKIKDTALSGVEKLQEQYNKLLVQIGYGNTKISMHEYNELEKRDTILTALEVGGVDNWEWYDESLKNAGLTED
jgi:hypothetical protein